MNDRRARFGMICWYCGTEVIETHAEHWRRPHPCRGCGLSPHGSVCWHVADTPQSTREEQAARSFMQLPYAERRDRSGYTEEKLAALSPKIPPKE